MPTLPALHAPDKTQSSTASDGVVFAVFAPLGTDEILSTYPGTKRLPIERQALVRALQKVAGFGVHVVALVDLYDDDTYVVDIPAGAPQQMQITSSWKEDMTSPRALAGFLRHVHARHPCAALVLALEGHGAGFLPEIDLERITAATATGGGQYQWQLGGDGAQVVPAPNSPALPVISPMLPVISPMLPAKRLPISTWGLGWALAQAQKAGVQRPAVIHFDNCFNMSVELLHTVAPHADYATGYANYNFFTAGAAYPRVFRRLHRSKRPVSADMLAKWFAAENAVGLRAKGNHPTIGATIRLADMGKVSKAVDRLAEELLALLDPARVDRAAQRILIQAAAMAAQQYDTEADYKLDPPDQITDLGGFAAQLQARLPAGGSAAVAAGKLLQTLQGVWQYGDFERPWPDENQIWDFRDQRLGVGILFPDPALTGNWDWRSPYYLSGKVDPAKPPAHRAVIPFLADRATGSPPWVRFIVEYHRGEPFRGFLRARAPEFPKFNATFERKLPPPSDKDQGPDGGGSQQQGA